jgi:coenzyme Q-binding protein COQ10
MPTHAEQRELPYSPEQLFDLVADIERYPEFLPWCRGARVFRREGEVLYADLVIGFKMFRERFTSRVTLTRPGRIDVEYVDGPFRHLNNHWLFLAAAQEGHCVIDFYIDFEFHSRVLRRALTPLFNEAVRRMISAFEARAHAIHGRPEDTVPTLGQLDSA